MVGGGGVRPKSEPMWSPRVANIFLNNLLLIILSTKCYSNVRTVIKEYEPLKATSISDRLGAGGRPTRSMEKPLNKSTRICRDVYQIKLLENLRFIVLVQILSCLVTSKQKVEAG